MRPTFQQIERDEYPNLTRFADVFGYLDLEPKPTGPNRSNLRPMRGQFEANEVGSVHFLGSFLFSANSMYMLEYVFGYLESYS